MLICGLEDVPDGDARGFVVERSERAALRLIVARRGTRVYVYENRCPHRGTPLDWAPDRFLDRDGEHLMCATHGALFRVEDGHCLAGPCVGDGLTKVTFEQRDGNIVLLGEPRI